MTTEERLAIAEEIIEAPQFNCMWIRVGGIQTQYSPSERKHTAFAIGDNRTLATSGDVIDCIHQARQKLAAERDAKKSPREKRLEEACARILRILEPSSPAGRLRDYLDDARKALKED